MTCIFTYVYMYIFEIAGELPGHDYVLYSYSMIISSCYASASTHVHSSSIVCLLSPHTRTVTVIKDSQESIGSNHCNS